MLHNGIYKKTFAKFRAVMAINTQNFKNYTINCLAVILIMLITLLLM